MHVFLQMLAKASTLVFETGAAQGPASAEAAEGAAGAAQTITVPALCDAPDSEHTILKELVARYSIAEDARCGLVKSTPAIKGSFMQLRLCSFACQRAVFAASEEEQGLWILSLKMYGNMVPVGYMPFHMLPVSIINFILTCTCICTSSCCGS